MSVFSRRVNTQVNYIRPYNQFFTVEVPAGAANELISIAMPDFAVMAKVVTIQTGDATTFGNIIADGVDLGGYVGPGGYKELDLMFYYNDEIHIKDEVQGRFTNTAEVPQTVSFTIYGWLLG